VLRAVGGKTLTGCLIAAESPALKTCRVTTAAAGYYRCIERLVFTKVNKSQYIARVGCNVGTVGCPNLNFCDVDIGADDRDISQRPVIVIAEIL
jgi:hypothetical protein